MVFFSVFTIPVVAAALKNITISVPEDISNHGDPNLVCTPASWTSVVLFYLGNYFAHAATVKFEPGERAIGMICDGIGSLLFPAFGALRGVTAITSLAIFAKSDLQKAARAGALCTVVRRSSWKPKAGDVVLGAMQRVVRGDAVLAATRHDQTTLLAENIPMDESSIHVYDGPWTLSDGRVRSGISRRIHGSCKLPEDYAIAILPRDAIIMPLDGQDDNSIISHHSSFSKMLIAMGQTIFAIATLYRTRGNQLSRFGYAAFGLTVAPYAVMSVVNLLGSLFCPEYPTMYLVESSIATEARRRGGYIQDTVGVLHEESITFQDDQSNSWRAFQSALTFEHSPDGQLVFHADSDHAFTVLEPPIDKDVMGPMLETLVPSCSPFVTNSKFYIKDAARGRKSKWVMHTVDQEGFEKEPNSELSNLELGMTVLVSILPLTIMGSISDFDPGTSTTAQRAWTMAWLIVGIVAGPFFSYAIHILKEDIDDVEYEPFKTIFSLVLFALLCAAPAIGGFVVVGQMLVAYGNCIRIN